jgi:hypothetical protein
MARASIVTVNPSSSLPQIRAAFQERPAHHQDADRAYVVRLLREEREQRARGRRCQPSVLWRNAQAVYGLDPETC